MRRVLLVLVVVAAMLVTAGAGTAFAQTLEFSPSVVYNSEQIVRNTAVYGWCWDPTYGWYYGWC